MDEPADFTFTNGTNARWAMGIDYGSKPDQSVTWTMFHTTDGRTAIAPSLDAAQKLTPPRRLGWEGQGGRHQDGMECEAELAQAIKRLADWDWHKATEGGTHVANAITALHGQRKADGRPSVFIPEIG